MTAKKIAPAQIEFSDLTATGATVHHAGALKVGALSAHIAGDAGQGDVLRYRLPFTPIGPNAIVQYQATFAGLVTDGRDDLVISRPLPSSLATILQNAAALHGVDVQ